MKISRFIAAAPALVFLVRQCSVSPGFDQVAGLPEMNRETKNGVFYIRVLDSDGKLTPSGSAFLVDRDRILATAHDAPAGLALRRL